MLVVSYVRPSGAWHVACRQQVLFPKRLGRPEEYAELACFLLTHDYMNGETIRMDGGIRMAPK